MENRIRTGHERITIWFEWMPLAWPFFKLNTDGVDKFQAMQGQVVSLEITTENGFAVLVRILTIALLLKWSFGAYFEVCNLRGILGFDSFKLKWIVGASLIS